MQGCRHRLGCKHRVSHPEDCLWPAGGLQAAWPADPGWQSSQPGGEGGSPGRGAARGGHAGCHALLCLPLSQAGKLKVQDLLTHSGIFLLDTAGTLSRGSPSDETRTTVSITLPPPPPPPKRPTQAHAHAQAFNVTCIEKLYVQGRAVQMVRLHMELRAVVIGQWGQARYQLQSSWVQPSAACLLQLWHYESTLSWQVRQRIQATLAAARCTCRITPASQQCSRRWQMRMVIPVKSSKPY